MEKITSIFVRRVLEQISESPEQALIAADTYLKNPFYSQALEEKVRATTGDDVATMYNIFGEIINGAYELPLSYEIQLNLSDMTDQRERIDLLRKTLQSTKLNRVERHVTELQIDAIVRASILWCYAKIAFDKHDPDLPIA